LVLFVIFCPDFLRFNRQDACWPHGLEGYVPVRVNRLEEILRTKRAEIERLRPRAAELDRSAKRRIRGEQARARTDFRSFHSALARADGTLALIAEIKKASPSAGVIAQSFDPVATARNYERAGAAAISVLTDERFFHGNLDDLVDVRRAVSLPILRKDFVLDEIQIAESAANGADAILLIVAALEQKQLATGRVRVAAATGLVDLLKAAEKYGLDALVEIHSREELDRALEAGAKIVGINNRDLATFDVDLAVTENLCRHVPDEIVLVSESGIKGVEDVARIQACGVDAVLIGEALMRGELSIEQLRGMN
jgi:indole-3-glycerol phosphate synthase